MAAETFGIKPWDWGRLTVQERFDLVAGCEAEQRARAQAAQQ